MKKLIFFYILFIKTFKLNSNKIHYSLEQILKMTFYRPPVHTIKKQPNVVINEETFPTLSNPANPTVTAIPAYFYKDKVKISINQKKNNEKESELPKGWIVLDGKYNSKKNRPSSPKEEEAKDEKTCFDFSPLIRLWRKRREDYIELYGYDHYVKIFGYGTYYHFHHLDEDTDPNLSNDETLLEGGEEDMSSNE